MKNADAGSPGRRDGWMFAGEMAIVLALFLADLRGWIPLSKIPFLLALGWLSLRLRGLRWRDAGFVLPARVWRAIALGLIAGIALELVQTYLTEPLVERLTGQPPDLSDWRFLVGHPGRLAAVLGLIWLGSLGEELIYRGYLMQRVAGIAGGGRAAWLFSWIAISALFGWAHTDQGLPGMTIESIAGLALGGLYLAAGRNLTVPIVAHVASNTLAMILIYLGRYPGL
jgi:hypothetical protein